MKRIALFPGTFDPITIGHINIIERALPLFDEVIVGIGHNSSKTTLFSPEQRLQWIDDVFRNESRVKVGIYEGLTVDYCEKVGADYILRGIRTMADFDYEKNIAQMNKIIHNSTETVFLMCDPAYTPISSSIVRDLIRNKADASMFLPKEVKY